MTKDMGVCAGMGPTGRGGQGAALRAPEAPAAAQQHVHGVPHRAHEAAAGGRGKETGATSKEAGTPRGKEKGGGPEALREGRGMGTTD